MKLLGVGIDVTSIARIRGLLDRYGARFERRWFDPVEVAQPGSRETRLARSYAVKEAVWKALPHATTSPLPWREIVSRPAASTDRVVVELRGTIAAEAGDHGVEVITANVTVRGDLVIAVALIEGSSRDRLTGGPAH